MSWRTTTEYRNWRSIVIHRDRECQVCKDKSNLHAHHIRDASNTPELRFEVSNGITLCKGCHTQFHTNYLHSYRERCTEVDLDNFLLLCKYLLNKK